MKKLIVLCALLLPLFSLAQNDEAEDQAAATSDRLIEQGGPDDDFISKALYTGVATDFYPNGQKKLEANFVNGKLDGVMMAWHENGQKEAETYFVKGKREGLMTMWHANGRRKALGNWVNDKPDGPWTVWYDNGQREFVGTYQSGQLIMGTQWRDENGHTQFRSD